MYLGLAAPGTFLYLGQPALSIRLYLRAGCPWYIFVPRAASPMYFFLYQGLPALGTRRYLGAVSPEVLSRNEGCQPLVKKSKLGWQPWLQKCTQGSPP